MIQTVDVNHPACPLPKLPRETIQLAHGGGGTLMHGLIDEVFLKTFNRSGGAPHDATVFSATGTKLAFTTDSFVVNPLFFPGGDIGSLAVHGTVNDLAMSGARPLCLSAGYILEEGLPIETLQRVARSMQRAAESAGCPIVTGDTKVVERGKGDGLYINTAGIGLIEHGLEIAPHSIRPGDAILVSGDIGRHGMAVMAQREGLEFDSTIESDSAPVIERVMQFIDAGIDVHCLRDLTRGGLASALNELAMATGLHFQLIESKISVRDDVRSACEILGFDPLYVACEGRFVAFVPARQSADALQILRAAPSSVGVSSVGAVLNERQPMVTMKTLIGSNRIVDMLSGEQLPRIC